MRNRELHRNISLPPFVYVFDNNRSVACELWAVFERIPMWTLRHYVYWRWAWNSSIRGTNINTHTHLYILSFGGKYCMTHRHQVAAHECDERFSNLYSKDTINIFMCATTVARFDVSLFSSIHRACGCIAFSLIFFLFGLPLHEAKVLNSQALYVSRFRSHVAAALTYRYFLLCKFILVSYLPRSTSDRCRWCHADNANAVPYSRKKANMCQEKCVYFIFIFISLDESRNSDNNGTEALWQQLNGEKKNWKKGNNE